MIELEPWLIGIIERHINASVIELLVGSLSDFEGNIRLHTAVFNALNSILKEAGSNNQDVIRCIQNSRRLNFWVVEEELASSLPYQKYLQALTKHVQLLRTASSSNDSIRLWLTDIL